MPIDPVKARSYIRNFDFQQLFIQELGWDQHRAPPLTVSLDGTPYTFTPVAEKRGLVAFLFSPGLTQSIPEYSSRRKIEKQIMRIAHEHLVIYADSTHTTQIWEWVKREIGKPAIFREQRYYKGHGGDLLVQRLQAITFELAEEEHLTIVDVAGRLRQAFDVERITKRFYEEYRKEHDLLQKSILGIESSEDRQWYASVTMDRLMFLYFIQKKHFLDNNSHYLRDHLSGIEPNKEQSRAYYERFLIPLFHEGLGQSTRPSRIEKLLGRVPYLNGGLFQIHRLERRYADIRIPDSAFKRVFDFFDGYQWHLDDRPLRADNEINPDVLGYIFEKYVNHRELGAYYSKEDITDYISKNTILPFLIEKLTIRPVSPADVDSFWKLLRDHPNRYIHPAVQKGVIGEQGSITELPKDISEGIADPTRRERWNSAADAEYSLPNEIWREFLKRRKQCLEALEALSQGKIRSSRDLITYNVDLRQFVQDIVEGCNSPLLLLSFWHAIESVRILDPTCGSGAFLFQALNVLESLYEACLDQMERMIEDHHESDDAIILGAVEEFRQVLNKIKDHPSRSYFALKSIMLNNLFGVDIMDEAVEICKLRLFLKLASRVEADITKPNLGLEPLPDLDFNIRAGNTLVGFSGPSQIRKALTSGQLRLGSEEILATIGERASQCDSAFRVFRELQSNHKQDDAILVKAKRDLGDRLSVLDLELDQYLAIEHGVSPSSTRTFDSWRQEYKPFHWFVEFYGIMKQGGFDVIIGNPPYLEIQEVNYVPRGFSTVETRAIHAMCIERCSSILKPRGCLSMIVPMSIVSTQRMEPVQRIIENERDTWYSNFAWRPGKLFDTVNRALSIFVAIPSTEPRTFSTNYQKWNAEGRDLLFQQIKYVEVPRNRTSFWVPKIDDKTEVELLRKCQSIDTTAAEFLGETDWRVFYRTTGGLYWKVFTDFSPEFKVEGKKGHSSRETWINLSRRSYLRPMIAILSSDLFWWWYTITTTCRDLNPIDIRSFPVPKSALDDPRLSELGKKYLDDLVRFSSILVRHQKQTGKTETQSFKILRSKHIIDEIDEALATHYQFSYEELDFLINYDIKYRMGFDGENNSEE